MTRTYALESCDRVQHRCVHNHSSASHSAEYTIKNARCGNRVQRIYEGKAQVMQLFVTQQMVPNFAECAGTAIPAATLRKGPIRWHLFSMPKDETGRSG